ncbi:MAG: type restriction enzyme subunit [Clostridiales bacterium]|nr:type restriction enzyme subunit [Clostridiales bacterium]
MKNITGWQTQKLEDIIEINPRSEKLDDDTEVTFLGMADVSNEGRILIRNTKVYSEVSKGFTSFKENDVLLAKITPCFENGKRALATNLTNGYGYGSTEFHVLRGNYRLIPEYIYQYVSMYDFMTRGEANMTGSAGQKRVPTDFVKSYEIPVPPLPEQKKIANILSAVDGHIDEVDSMIQDLKELKKGLMQKLLTEGIGHTEFKDSEVGRIPEDWDVKLLGEVIKLQGGYAFKSKKFQDVGINVLRISNVKEGYLDISDCAKYPLELLANLDSFKLEAHDSVIAMSGATTGKVGYVRDHDLPIYLNQRVGRFVVKTSDIDRLYLYYSLNTEYFQTRIWDFAIGGAQPNISGSQIESIEIQVPSIEEQKSIAYILGNVDERISLYECEMNDLNDLKKGLMQQLLTGKTRVKIDN